MQEEAPNCARCPYKVSDRICRTKEGKAPEFCPTKNMSACLEQSMKEYHRIDGVGEFAKQASIQEAEGYMNRELGAVHVRAQKTRIEEIMGFAEKMGYKRLGIAFCIGLRKEAVVAEKVFSAAGFDVISVVCKVGRTPKQQIGVAKEQQILGTYLGRGSKSTFDLCKAGSQKA